MKRQKLDPEKPPPANGRAPCRERLLAGLKLSVRVAVEPEDQSVLCAHGYQGGQLVTQMAERLQRPRRRGVLVLAASRPIGWPWRRGAVAMSLPAVKRRCAPSLSLRPHRRPLPPVNTSMREGSTPSVHSVPRTAGAWRASCTVAHGILWSGRIGRHLVVCSTMKPPG